jgi:hypothetical protein
MMDIREDDSIHEDEAFVEAMEDDVTYLETDDEVEDAFFSHLTDGANLSDDEAEEAAYRQEETAAFEAEYARGEEDDQDGIDPDQEPDAADPMTDADAQLASDDLEVAVTVDGVEERVSVKDLKRLAGQEKALTQKSQEVAQERQRLENSTIQNGLVLKDMLGNAAAAWEPYSQIDFFEASKHLSEPEFEQLKRDAEAAYNNLEYFKQTAGSAVETFRGQQHAQMHEQARSALPVIKQAIPDWGPERYRDVVDYAVNAGMPGEMALTITDPAAIIMIHKAALYDKGQRAVNGATARKKGRAPKRVVKGVQTPTSDQGNRSAKAKALARIRKSGGADEDAIMDGFLSTL